MYKPFDLNVGIEHVKAVRSIDPALMPFGYCHGRDGRTVYLVGKDQPLLVLKTSDLTSPSTIITEADALEQTADLCATLTLRDVYFRDGRPFALLKDFVPGVLLDQAKVRLNLHAKKSLFDVVDRLHGRGFHDLDLHGKNIVATPSGDSAGIIDLDSARVTNPQLDDTFYKIWCNKDLEVLARTLGV